MFSMGWIVSVFQPVLMGMLSLHNSPAAVPVAAEDHVALTVALDMV